MPANTDVFVNCPYDKRYYPLLRPLIFTLVFFELNPRMSFESSQGEQRLDKIIKMIHEAPLSIHDISRYKARKAKEHYRLNMAFELGIDYGCKECPCKNNIEKKFLIMSNHPFEHQKAISDLSGVDLEYHKDRVKEVITIVRNWLKINSPGEVKAQANTVVYRYNDFIPDLTSKVSSSYHSTNLNLMPIKEYIEFINNWFAEKNI